MQFQPYLMFDGSCAQAMCFYERVIGGKLEPLLKYSEMPEPCADMPAGERRPDRSRLPRARRRIADGVGYDARAALRGNEELRRRPDLPDTGCRPRLSSMRSPRADR